MQRRAMLKKPARVRDNNGVLQVRLRLDEWDHFINRLGRLDDPVAQAMAQAICAEIWRDAQQGDLDLSLNRYRPLVEGRDQDLLDARNPFAEEKKQARHDSCSSGGEVVLLTQSDQCRGCSLVGIDARSGACRVQRALHLICFHVRV